LNKNGLNLPTHFAEEPKKEEPGPDNNKSRRFCSQEQHPSQNLRLEQNDEILLVEK